MGNGQVGMPLITLQPFTILDFPRLMQWTPSAEALMQWAGPSFTFPLELDQAADYMAPASGLGATRRVYRAALSTSGEVVGHVDLSNIDLDHRAASVCRVLVEPDRRRQGIGRQMMQQVIRVGFNELHLHRLDLRVFDFNAPAIACYEKVGFVQEGVLRDWLRTQDEYWSVVVMSLLETEWHEA